MYMAHAGFANVTKWPNAAITEDEAKKLADAAQRVARHYELPGIAQETKDWIGLIIVIGSVYGPRIGASTIEAIVEPDGSEGLLPANNVVNLNPIPGLTQ
ncbi:MAG: hypothetical protein ACHP7O_12700 [Burkholderiales bacterium]